MIEPLGPNMARSLMGDAYNPDFRYELETDDDGFHVIIINTADGTSSSVKLDPEAPDPQRIAPIWGDGLEKRLPKKDLFSRLMFWCCIAACAVCVAAALLL